MHAVLYRLLPFLRWFPLTTSGPKADLVAGITVALVLVPQSMAYAQLAGLPVVYGLYSSFIPVIIASLWGSSSQLHTGPVAMLSLMSAAALIPLANPGSASFIELSIMLALMVGVLRLLLGLLSLGAIVNMLSSPVIVGFTNAAALIIGLSQLSKVLGVPFPRTESYLADLWRVVRQITDTHIPTLLFAVGTWVLIAGLRKYRPGLPGVLFAVILATLASGFMSFENKITVKSIQIADPVLLSKMIKLDSAQKRMEEILDGEMQSYTVSKGAYIRDHFFGKYPELLKLVETYSDEQVRKLRRGGHGSLQVGARQPGEGRRGLGPEPLAIEARQQSDGHHDQKHRGQEDPPAHAHGVASGRARPRPATRRAPSWARPAKRSMPPCGMRRAATPCASMCRTRLPSCRRPRRLAGRAPGGSIWAGANSGPDNGTSAAGSSPSTLN